MSDERPSLIRRWAKPVLLTFVALFALRIIINLFASIDWSAVWAAIGLLTALPIALLLVALASRQTFNAIPLTQFVPGLTLARSMQNDATALLMGTVAPPPTDVVIRVSQFRSWGLDPVEGMAGVTLNMLAFYVVRFGSPALGVLLLASHEIESGRLWQAATSVLIAVVIVAALISLSRGDRLAASIGYTAGRVIRKIRPGVDPDAWAEAVVEFRGKVGDRAQKGLGPSLAALLGMLLSEAAMVLIAVRAVGVTSAEVPTAVILGTFLFAYPLTLFPLMGLGVLDAVLVAAWTQFAGPSVEAEVVAGLIIWRTVSLLMPFALGVGALLIWRRGVHNGPPLPPAG